MSADEDSQYWHFTFGGGQRLMAARSDGTTAGEGFSLANFYVEIYGTFASARAEMIRRFGQIWSNQYAPEDWAGMAGMYGLVELFIPVPAARP
jgi:hypothetical protein